MVWSVDAVSPEVETLVVRVDEVSNQDGSAPQIAVTHSG